MFTRIRTIAGRRYLYEEIRYREGGKVRSISRSLGPVDQPKLGHGGYLEQMEQYPVDETGNRIQEGAPEMEAPDQTITVEPVSPQTPATPSEQSPADAPASEPSSEPVPPSDQD